LFERRLTQSRLQLEQFWRLAQSYHPDKPLERGYARVERRTKGGESGGVLTSAQAALAAQRLTLCFADGKVDVQTERASVERASQSRYKPPQPEQPKLL
jgi:exodeoxyribonuclease VII large subunit